MDTHRRPATLRRGLLLLSMVAPLLLSAAASAQIVSPDEPVRLVSARTIQIPDVRILSMSPEGSSIVGVRPMVGSRRDGKLCVFDTVTLAERSCAGLSRLDAGIRMEDVTWSPDGSLLAFGEEAFKVYLDGDLWLMDAATGKLTNLDDDGFEGSLPVLGRDPNTDPITIGVSPTFTSDGRSVTWSRSTIVDGHFVGNDIATVPVTGGPAESLLSVSSDRPGIVYYGMHWTDDGSTLFYNVNDVDPSSPRNGIWSVPASGLGSRLIAGATDPDLGEPAVLQVARDAHRLLAWYPRTAGRVPMLKPLALIDPHDRAPHRRWWSRTRARRAITRRWSRWPGSHPMARRFPGGHALHRPGSPGAGSGTSRPTR